VILSLAFEQNPGSNVYLQIQNMITTILVLTLGGLLIRYFKRKYNDLTRKCFVKN